MPVVNTCHRLCPHAESPLLCPSVRPAHRVSKKNHGIVLVRAPAHGLGKNTCAAAMSERPEDGLGGEKKKEACCSRCPRPSAIRSATVHDRVQNPSVRRTDSDQTFQSTLLCLSSIIIVAVIRMAYDMDQKNEG